MNNKVKENPQKRQRFQKAKHKQTKEPKAELKQTYAAQATVKTLEQKQTTCQRQRRAQAYMRGNKVRTIRVEKAINREGKTRRREIRILN